MILEYYLAKLIKKLRLKAIKNSQIHSTSKIESGSHIVKTFVGKHSFCGYNCEITYTDIGNYCSIANNVIIGGGAHPISWVSTSPVFYYGKDSVKKKFSEFHRAPVLRTTVGSDVWIGAGVIIKQGVNVGTGSVIGMGSVVTKDIPPYAIVGGVPAKILKYRFSQEIIDELLKSEWWLMDDSLLSEFVDEIRNPDRFINNIRMKQKNGL